MVRRFILIVFSLTILFSCRKKSINCGVDCGAQTEELIFQTGFSNTVITNGAYKNAKFSGTDSNYTEKNNWEAFDQHNNIGYVEIGYEDGDDNQRLASITTDPDNPSNKVLKYQLFEPHIKVGSETKGRIQLSVHENKCIKELYQKVKLKLHPDMAYFKEMSEKLYWFTFFEFWNNGAFTKEKYPFRISVNLFKAEGSGNDLNFRVKADYQNCRTCNWKEVWGETATVFPLVFGEWMEIELYLLEGDMDNGQFKMTVTPEGGSKVEVFDIQNTTQHPKEKCPDGFSHFEAMKVYTSSDNIKYMNDANKALILFWDDWELEINKNP